ncbi:protein SNOWY COTYLEDON 3-like [Dioscorea cayenensis subsp. rotundata]|uniref:Protein SNOWY COTYLEDON 3-like n=1 Tax=Dioscorea cayennensis subsp. rotundata TaxID=55577 RepID=A0AB40CHX3_DIOCR|nr:protein SNOWY COTYLEDON 3-like [Dioscorea cayenensis subsp. rotundata]
MVAVPLSPSDHQNATISTPKTSKDSTFTSPSPSSSSSSSSSPSPTSLLHRSHSRSRSLSSSKYLTTTTRSLSVSFQGESFFFQSTKAKPSQSENSRWPPARPFSSVRLLVLDDADASSEADSHSSGSNSDKGGAATTTAPSRHTPRGISVPARFWQETNSRLRRSTEPPAPLPPKKPFLACKNAAGPLMVRSNGNAPSIISFAAQLKKGKKGEGRIEEAHLLRLLHNRLLQWRCVNARANASLSARRLAVEKSLYSAWITTSGLQDSVTNKRTKLHLLTQNLRLASVLNKQMAYLEEWSLMDDEHSSSLTGAIESLKASILRLPVIDGARVDVQVVKNAVGNAINMMEAMSSSMSSLLPKVEGMHNLLTELSKLAALEEDLLAQSRDLLSTVAMLHVKQCSLRGHILQLNCR